MIDTRVHVSNLNTDSILGKYAGITKTVRSVYLLAAATDRRDVLHLSTTATPLTPRVGTLRLEQVLDRSTKNKCVRGWTL